jgi:hypothetical protein
MVRFFIHPLLIGILLLLLLMNVMIALGNRQAIHPALRGFTEGCEEAFFSCWYGVIPNETTLEEATTTIGNTDHDCESVFYYYTTDIVEEMALVGCANLRLGDVIDTFGEPVFFHMDERGRGELVYLDMRLSVYFSQGLTLYTPVDRISINGELSGVDSFEWYGYIPYWRYCQIHWDNYGCEFG